MFALLETFPYQKLEKGSFPVFYLLQGVINRQMVIKMIELVFHPEQTIRKSVYKILASLHAVAAAKSKMFIQTTFLLSLGEYQREK